MFFISLSNNREYFSKQKFNRYLNPYLYYLLILLGMQQLNILFLDSTYSSLLQDYMVCYSLSYLEGKE